MSLPIAWVTFFANAGQIIDTSTTERIARLVSQRFPQVESSVNCHGSSMYATGVITVLVGIDTEPKYLENGCFTEVSKPGPGDLGFFVLNVGNDSFYLHSFAYVDSGHIFHKANPGWDTNPFELIPIDVEHNLMKLFASYSNAKLRWGHYTPAPECFLFRFQGWLNRHRHHSRFADMIQTMEANAEGRPAPMLGDHAFIRILREVDRRLKPVKLIRKDSVDSLILQVMHEYLMLPQFAESRMSLTTRRLTEARQTFSIVLSSLKDVSDVSPVMKSLLAQASLSYQTASIALFDTSRVAYLKIPAADFTRIQNFSITTDSLKIISTDREIKVTSPSGTWIFRFTS